MLRDRYRVERELGSGGMATVYLAEDLQSGASVAIKVLREALATRVSQERFNREIRIASRLDHPRIVRVVASDEVGGVLYCVMPYVAGETLRERLARERQLPASEAVQIASEVADALAYAHDMGFIHRDIKPANILLSPNGAVITDFGVARALDSSTDAETMTTTGLAVGTPAYMAPEQTARDRDLDGRVDIYGLGCVLYEMLAGEPPFAGSAWTMAARHVAQIPAPVRAMRPGVAPEIEHVVMRALEKAPADRYPNARAFDQALRGALSAKSRAPRAWRRAGIAAAIVGSFFIGWAALALKFHQPPPQVARLTLLPPTGARFSSDLREISAVSPDGADIIVSGTDTSGIAQLWLRPLAKREAVRIPGTDRGRSAFWSPDGKRIGFFQEGKVVVIDRAGGESRPLARISTDPKGASWADNGNILYAPSSQSGIFVTSLGDTASRQLTKVSAERGEIGHMWPQALPGGREFLYFVASDLDSIRGVYLGSTTDPRGRRITPSSVSAVYAQGYLLYVQAGKLVARQLDIRNAKLFGPRLMVADSVATSFEYYGVFSASRNGVLVYAGGGSRDVSRLTWTDAKGAVRGYASGDAYLRNPALSRDGRHLAYESYREAHSEIRYVDLTTGVATPLSLGSGQPLDPVWSPDGSAFAFIQERPGGVDIYRKDILRPGAPTLIYRSSRYTVINDWSTRDRLLLLTERNEAGDYDVVARSINKPENPVILAGGPATQGGARVSPDEQVIAYVEFEGRRPHLFVQRFSVGGARCDIGEGFQPVWAAKPGDLYFLSMNGTAMHASVDLTRAAPCPVATPTALFDARVPNPSAAKSSFDVSLKTGLLLINMTAPAALNVTINWLAAAADSLQ